MDQTSWVAVDNYFSNAFIGDDSLMLEVLMTNSKNDLPPWDVSPNQGKLLQILVQSVSARRVLEVGTLGAYSTIWMARGMQSGGKIISLELDTRYADVARSNVKRAGFENTIEVRVGKALETLEKMTREMEEPFDFVFIDADKVNNANYFSWALKMSRKGTIIIVDNVVRNGAVVETNSTDPSVQGVRNLTQMLSQDRRIEVTALQTVGSKGWDGFILASVK